MIVWRIQRNDCHLVSVPMCKNLFSALEVFAAEPYERSIAWMRPLPRSEALALRYFERC